MMHTPAEISAEAEALFATGAVDDAVRFSGEELALADNRWRIAHNARRDDAAACAAAVGAIAVVHCDMLFRAGLFADVLATSLTALMTLAVDGDNGAADPNAVMALLALALMALDRIGETLPRDSHTEEHFPVVVRYCASMLYAWYARTAAAPTVWHTRVNPLLRELIAAGAVTSPDIDVNGTPVAATDLAAILGDMMGRARAIL